MSILDFNTNNNKYYNSYYYLCYIYIYNYIYSFYHSDKTKIHNLCRCLKYCLQDVQFIYFWMNIIYLKLKSNYLNDKQYSFQKWVII